LYLIYGKKIYLIDTGVATSEKIIFDYIRKTGRNPEDISLIILTHSHPDHIGAAHEIKRATGSTIAAHHGERSWIEDVELQHRERPVPCFHSLVGGSVMIDRILENGDIQHIHEAVTEVDMNDISHDPMELCRLVLRKLKLPEMTANPLIARSFEAHRKVSDNKDMQKQLFHPI
jgi:metal-dependent hydrolase (beta-lactamase superfamily II)